MGFDYQGHKEQSRNNVFRLNNMFGDTRNYKKRNEAATFYGNWMNQTKRCLQDFPDIKFYRVGKPDGFKPKDLEWNENLKHMDLAEFTELFNL